MTLWRVHAPSAIGSLAVLDVISIDCGRGPRRARSARGRRSIATRSSAASPPAAWATCGSGASAASTASRSSSPSRPSCPSWPSTTQFRTMLLDEARICSRLHHANVAQILDVGERKGSCPTSSSSGWTARRSSRPLHGRRGAGAPVPPGRCSARWPTCASGLHAAHELTRRGRRAARRRPPRRHAANVIVSTRRLREAHRLRGRARRAIASPARRAAASSRARRSTWRPSRRAATKVDRRADVWAVGAVLYRGLRGARPSPTGFALEAYIHERCDHSAAAGGHPRRREGNRRARAPPRSGRPLPDRRGDGAGPRAGRPRARWRSDDAELFPMRTRAPSTPEAPTQPEALGIASTQFAGIRKAERSGPPPPRTDTRWRLRAFVLAASGGAAVAASVAAIACGARQVVRAALCPASGSCRRS